MEANDIIIEGSTARWNMPRMEGELGTYTGSWTFRCYLTPLQQLQAGREYRQYLGEHAGQATETEANLAFALGQLKQRVIKAPPFWTSTIQESGIAGDIADLAIVAAILDAAIRSETLFKDKISKERQSILDRSIKMGEDTLKKQAEE